MRLGPPFVRVPYEGGRKLTPDEVEQEVRDIETKVWPHNSVLPVKNLYDDRVGCIFRTFDGGPETIVPEITLLDKTADPLAFENLRAMVVAGWVAD